MPSLPTAPIALRLALPEDEMLLFQLFAESRAPSFLAAGMSSQQVSMLMRSQFSLRQISYARQYPHAIDRIALSEEGKAAGRILLAWNEAEPIGNIVDIAVLSHCQRHGIGTVMLEDCTAEARRRRALLRLSVDRENPALRLYTRHGFSITGTTELQFRMELDCR